MDVTLNWLKMIWKTFAWRKCGKLAALAAVGLSLMAVTGCEDEESNDLAKAQECMDKISSSNWATADICMAFVAKYDSQQSNILKCAIKFLDNGLTTDKVVAAYQALSQNADSNDAVFMTALAMDNASDAEEARIYCNKSQLKGLIYLANLAVAGTALADVGEALGLFGGGGQYDPADPSSIGNLTSGDVEAVIDDCKPGGAAASCTSTELEAIGSAVESISTTYCVGSNADSEICQSVSAAIAGAGGDPEQVANHLLCLLDGQSGYDGVNCVP
jgi:hypothetical protein